MGKLLWDKWCIFTCLALMMVVMANAALERQYFFVSRNYTWVEASKYCQKCYKDLVTVTPENTQLLSQRIMNETSSYWIGLRKHFDTIISNNESSSNISVYDDYDYYNNDFAFNSTDNSTNNSTNSPTLVWTNWVNGDPLSFQNWQPGWPAPKFPLPKIDCCSCSCTCPVKQRPTQTQSTTATSSPFSTVQNSPSLARADSSTKSSSLTNATDQNVTNSLHQTTTANNMDISTDFTDISSHTDVTDMTSFSKSSMNDVTNATDTSSFSKSSMSNVTNATDASSSTNSISQGLTKSTSSWQSSYTSQVTTPYTSTRWRFQTELPIESTCQRSPTPPPTVPAPYDNYIKDSCVAMLTFGTWIEKHCEEELPFICYEDIFMGKVDVTNITFQTASLSWQIAPGGSITYRVEVSGDTNWVINTTNLTQDLLNLTAGTQYSIQVVSIKCERDLNPQKASFYTVPLKVENLTVTSVAETSVNLTWNHPVGNWSFYSIRSGDRVSKSTTESFNFDGLTPGTLYTFTVLTGVEDKSQWSKESNVTAYTKPGKVTNLNVSGNTDRSVTLNWNAPNGGFTGFIVFVNDSRRPMGWNESVDIPSSTPPFTKTVSNLSSGDKIFLNVTAVANYTLLGDNVSTVSYTTPLRISNLILKPTDSYINASWDYNITNSNAYFNIELQLVGSQTKKQANATDKFITFNDLQNAANYTVTVYAVSGTLRSPPVSESSMTLPKPPTNAKVISKSNDSITFAWSPPDNVAANVTYSVSICSGFWGYSKTVSVLNQNSHKFEKLTSGTNYNFSVFIVTAIQNSDPAKCTGMTDAVNTMVSLSMMCSSSNVLQCDVPGTRTDVLAQLQNHVRLWLGQDISWNLESSTSPNT